MVPPLGKIQQYLAHRHHPQISRSNRSAASDISSLNPIKPLSNPLPSPFRRSPRRKIILNSEQIRPGAAIPQQILAACAIIAVRPAYAWGFAAPPPRPRLRRRRHHGHVHLPFPRHLDHCEYIPLSLTLITGHTFQVLL
jgi:hypothetical protein